MGDDNPIKVTDHRKFDREGRLRPDALKDGPESKKPAAPPPRGQETKTAASRTKNPAAPPPRGQETKTAASGQADPRPGRAVDFQQFVYFLYMSALHELGVPTETGAPARQPDLERSRFFIDVLQILKEKTAGNLAAGETKLLEDVLYNLQMQFVAVSGQPSA